MRKQFLTALENSKVEKDVENAYREEIKHYTEAEVTSPHSVDGYAQWKSVRLLLEAKYDEQLKDRVKICGVLGQVIAYLKKFEKAGDVLPNVLFIGDKNECVVLATASVQQFMNLPIDWNFAPSKGNPALTRALVEGLNILPYVYDVDGNLSFRAIIEKCEVLANGECAAIRATTGNIVAMFSYWVDRVFRDKAVTPIEQADIFLRCLFQPMDVYLHPKKKGILIVPGYSNVIVDADQYRSFFDHFMQGYRPSEIAEFYAMKDRLIEDDARRRQGAFFTPQLWVDEAHKAVSAVLGENWKQDCIVWDPAAGTANLTRDYAFADLIISTAEKSDIDVIKEQEFNRGASVFQYDFLNPDSPSPFFADGSNSRIPPKVHQQLQAAANAGKRLVFFMNPPYGTAATAGTTTDSKAGIALTATNTDMKIAKLGACSQQLYVQFMYRATALAKQYGFTRWTIAQFSKPTFMCSGSYKKFRYWWYSQYRYESGFMFQASHFADVSGRWGVLFSVWNSPGHTNSTVTLPATLKDIKDFDVVNIGNKAFYSADNKEASEWVHPTEKPPAAELPFFSSGLLTKDVDGNAGILYGHLYWLHNDSNIVMKSGTDVYMLSAGDARARGTSVLPSNWHRAVALYAARKLVEGNWINDKDEYLAPAENHPDYEQWVNDCHIYALLHTSNNCTAMRDVQYKGKTWQIHNNWFWRSREYCLHALDTHDTPALWRDCKQDNTQPYFAENIPPLSIDAQHVLNLLNELWTRSLAFREDYALTHPELHLNAWDAGVYQLKHLWRELFPEEWKELQTAHKVLANRLQRGVYTFGFLRE